MLLRKVLKMEPLRFTNFLCRERERERERGQKVAIDLVIITEVWGGLSPLPQARRKHHLAWSSLQSPPRAGCSTPEQTKAAL